MSLFRQDLSQESILQSYLNQVYIKAGLDFTRIGDKNLQNAGIDVIMKGKKRAVKVDEKAQLHYINESLPTFAMEISYLKGGNEHEGWLFDDKKITEAYALVFDIMLKGQIFKLTRPSDIDSCEVMLVYRHKLIEALQVHGLTREFCMEKSKVLRQEPGKKKIIINRNFNFQISSHLAEAPVNLIIKRSFLRTVCARVI